MDGAQIRLARAEDADPVAALSVQLGYPIDAARTADLLTTLPDDNVVLVAVTQDGNVIGWLQVIIRDDFLVSGRVAAVAGIVIDESCRNQGVGRALMEAGEAWAAGRGAAEIMLNTNTKRRETHGFYEHIGYTRVKTQARYMKRLKA